MIYVLHMLDRPGTEAPRVEVRSAHKAYLAHVADRIAFAGPLLSDDGLRMTGSLLAIDFDSAAAVREWLDTEPFTRAGVYEHTRIHRFDNLWPQRAGFPPSA